MLSGRRLVASKLEPNPFWLWFVHEGFSQNFHQSCLTFGYPAGVVVRDGFLVIAQHIGHVGDRYTAFKKNACKVWRKQWGVGGSSNSPAQLHTLFIRERDTSVTVSRRSELKIRKY